MRFVTQVAGRVRPRQVSQYGSPTAPRRGETSPTAPVEHWKTTATPNISFTQLLSGILIGNPKGRDPVGTGPQPQGKGTACREGKRHAG